MRIAGMYSFKGGQEEVTARYPELLQEVKDVIRDVDTSAAKTKQSKEKTMMDLMLFSPKVLNAAFKAQFAARNWASVRVPCAYSTEHYVEGYQARRMNPGAFREMDFVKGQLGI